MLLDQIQSDLVAAQKKKDATVVETLRFLLGAIGYRRIELSVAEDRNLSDEQILAVIKKQVKTHKESIEMFEKGKRDDLVSKEKAQLVILESYLPEQLGEDKIRGIIASIKAANPTADFGSLMKLTLAELKGQADGSTIAKILKED